MLKLLVAYKAYDGHTAKIAGRIASTLRQGNCAVELCDLARSRPDRPLEDYDGVIAGGPLHGGKHHPQLLKFASQNCDVLNEQPSAFFSVSLSAAGNVEQQGDATRCLNEFLDDIGGKPSASASPSPTCWAGRRAAKSHTRWLCSRVSRTSPTR